MGDAACQSAKTFHALRAQELGFEFFLFGNIAEKKKQVRFIAPDKETELTDQPDFFAKGAGEMGFTLLRASGGQGFFRQLEQVRIAPRFELPEVLVQKLGHRGIDRPGGCLVGQYTLTGRPVNENPYGSVRDDFLVKIERLSQGVLQPLALGDVLKGGAEAGNAPVVVVKNPVLNQDRQKDPILSPIVLFHQLGSRRFPRQPGHDRFSGFLPFGNKVPNEMPRHFFGGISQHDQFSVINPGDAPLLIQLVITHRSIFKQRLKLHFALFEFLLGSLALGNIFLDGQKVSDVAGVVVDRGNGSPLPIKFAVLLPVVKFSTPLPASDDRLPQSLVILRRHFARLQNAGIFADHFPGRITRQLHELRVDVFDVTGLVGNDDGNRTMFDGERQLADFFIRPLALPNHECHHP